MLFRVYIWENRAHISTTAYRAGIEAAAAVTHYTLHIITHTDSQSVDREHFKVVLK